MYPIYSNKQKPIKWRISPSMFNPTGILTNNKLFRYKLKNNSKNKFSLKLSNMFIK